jgi:outer membrane protein, heavy metal efflux system
MKIKTKIFIPCLILFFLIGLHDLKSQNIDTNNKIQITYKEYWSQILHNNLTYLSQQFNIQIADAKIQTAKVCQNPNLSIEGAGSGQLYTFSEYEFTAELSKTFELFPKRKARIDLANVEKELSKALLKDFLQNLQAQATLDFLDALKNQYLFEVTHNSYVMMRSLAEGDSVRFQLGSINAIDASQSKIEAGILFNEMIHMDAIRKNGFHNLTLQTGKFYLDTFLFPVGSLHQYDRIFDLNYLLVMALNNRADLEAAGKTCNVFQKNLTLIKRNRLADFDLSVGASNSYGNQIIFGNQINTEIYAGISIPLNFSNFNKGEIKMAQYQVKQAELDYHQIELVIQNEVIQAFNNYKSLCRQVENFNQGLLEQSKLVLNGKIYSYNRGETSLLEVLNAQRTYNELQISYIETLFSCYAALVELEKISGFWDISFE